MGSSYPNTHKRAVRASMGLSGHILLGVQTVIYYKVNLHETILQGMQDDVDLWHEWEREDD